MRPVDKNPSIQVTNYQDAAPHLKNRLGHYCSYCERRLETHLAVEHICPKGVQATGHLINTWDNFLLACTNCNSTKNDTPITPATLNNYLWPDVDNTLRAFKYVSGLVLVSDNIIGQAIENIVQETIKLTGLDKIPGHQDPQRTPSQSDQRWIRRQEIWDKAQLAKERLIRSNNSIEMQEQIIDTASESGHFSIWYTVFIDYVEIKQRLVNTFTGTDHTSFDNQTYNLMPRQQGQL